MKLPAVSNYEDIYKNFSWDIPEYFNIADEICDKWAEDEDRIAITYEDSH
jgi:acetyl-CoA synthetase